MNMDRFTQEQCDDLFAAILVHDDIYPDAALPSAIHSDYTPEQLANVYGLCRQLWATGVDYAELARITDTLYRDRSISDDDLRRFKYIRAKFKHLQFSYITCDARHRYPNGLHWMTVVMGEVQDAFKHSQIPAIGRYALLLKSFMTPVASRLIHRKVADFRPGTSADLKAHIANQIDQVRSSIARPTTTGQEFHNLRKVISRQTAFYDTTKILYPSPYHEAVLKSFSTINGLMGGLHDELVKRRFRGEQDYRKDRFAMPDDIRHWLTTLAQAYQSA